jgi:hypothetical protein
MVGFLNNSAITVHASAAGHALGHPNSSLRPRLYETEGQIWPSRVKNRSVLCRWRCHVPGSDHGGRHGTHTTMACKRSVVVGPDVDVSPAASTSADAWLERHGNRLDLSSPAFYVRPLLFSPISLLPLPCSFQCVFPVRWRRRFSRHQSPIIAAPATSPRPSRDFASRRPMNGFAACKFISQVPCRVGQIQRPYSVLPLLPLYFLWGEKKTQPNRQRL